MRQSGGAKPSQAKSHKKAGAAAAGGGAADHKLQPSTASHSLSSSPASRFSSLSSGCCGGYSSGLLETIASDICKN